MTGKINLIAVLALKHAKATGDEWSLDPPRIATIRNDKIIYIYKRVSERDVRYPKNAGESVNHHDVCHGYSPFSDPISVRTLSKHLKLWGPGLQRIHPFRRLDFQYHLALEAEPAF